MLTDGDQADISVERYDDVNTIASVLKLYFRLLPIPLITFDIYFKLIDTVRESHSVDFVLVRAAAQGGQTEVTEKSRATLNTILFASVSTKITWLFKCD